MKMSKGKTLRLLRAFKGVPEKEIADRFKGCEPNPLQYVRDLEEGRIHPRREVESRDRQLYAMALEEKASTLKWFLRASDPEDTLRDPRKTTAKICLRWLYFLDKIGGVSNDA